VVDPSEVILDQVVVSLGRNCFRDHLLDGWKRRWKLLVVEVTDGVVVLQLEKIDLFFLICMVLWFDW
jgi:hypothetical protein